MPEISPTTLTPEAQAALDTFRRTYPDFPTTVDAWPSYIQKHPQAAKDWATLQIVAKPPKDYRIDPASGGLIHNSSLKKYLAMSALLIGSVATAGTLAAATGGAAAGGAGASGASAGAGGGAAAGAGLGASSIWRSVVANAIPVAGQIASTVVQSKANSDANRLEQEAADRALKQQKEMYDADVAREQQRYDQNRGDLEGYRNIGNSSLSALARGTGQPDPVATRQPPSVAGVNPPEMPPQGGSLNTLGDPSRSLTVAMIAPDGRPIQVPQPKVAEATQRGARMA